MARALLVTQPFDGREVGSHITDPAEVEKALADHGAFVTPVEGEEHDDEHA